MEEWPVHFLVPAPKRNIFSKTHTVTKNCLFSVFWLLPTIIHISGLAGWEGHPQMLCSDPQPKMLTCPLSGEGTLGHSSLGLARHLPSQPRWSTTRSWVTCSPRPAGLNWVVGENQKTIKFQLRPPHQVCSHCQRRFLFPANEPVRRLWLEQMFPCHLTKAASGLLV